MTSIEVNDGESPERHRYVIPDFRGAAGKTSLSETAVAAWHGGTENNYG